LIALDSSAVARHLDDMRDDRSVAVRRVIDARLAVFPPVVLTELLSNPILAPEALDLVRSVPLLNILPGYWERAGLLRANAKRDRFKAEVADCLIAQSCIDHDIPLITYDLDFRHFVRAGLKLL